MPTSSGTPFAYSRSVNIFPGGVSGEAVERGLLVGGHGEHQAGLLEHPPIHLSRTMLTNPHPGLFQDRSRVRGDGRAHERRDAGALRLVRYAGVEDERVEESLVNRAATDVSPAYEKNLNRASPFRSCPRRPSRHVRSRPEVAVNRLDGLPRHPRRSQCTLYGAQRTRLDRTANR